MKVSKGLLNELADEYLCMGYDPEDDEKIADFARACEMSGLEINSGDLKTAVQKIMEKV